MANLKIIITVALISLVVVVESRPNKPSIIEDDQALRGEIERNRFIRSVEPYRILDNVEKVHDRKRRSDGEGGNGEGGDGEAGNGEGGDGEAGNGEDGNGGNAGSKIADRMQNFFRSMWPK
ncbi:uncharacterized protein LOC142326632 isoform X1 [Lycorma delicatula]|uniref:uncharacterized protein LOC142326632 isoform X1 n=1 Tax=Lycorma delicatula TaxID=130591 RepID=UPI003F516198